MCPVNVFLTIVIILLWVIQSNTLETEALPNALCLYPSPCTTLRMGVQPVYRYSPVWSRVEECRGKDRCAGSLSLVKRELSTGGQAQGSKRWLTHSPIAQVSIEDAHRCWEARHCTLSRGRLAGIPGQVCWQAPLSLIPEALVFVKCKQLKDGV